MNIVFEPECAVQPYLKKDVNLVRKCGKIEGYKNAFVVTLIILILTYFSDGKLDMPNITMKKGIIVITLILITWLLVPLITTYSQIQYWRGLKHEMKALKDIKLENNEVIRHMQKLHNKNLEQSFITTIKGLIPFI